MAGRSLRRVRSPDAPKITTAWGSGGFTTIGSPFLPNQPGGQLLQVDVVVPQEGGVDAGPGPDQPGRPPDVLRAVQPGRGQDHPVPEIERGEPPVLERTANHQLVIPHGPPHELEVVVVLVRPEPVRIVEGRTRAHHAPRGRRALL